MLGLVSIIVVHVLIELKLISESDVSDALLNLVVRLINRRHSEIQNDD